MENTSKLEPCMLRYFNKFKPSANALDTNLSYISSYVFELDASQQLENFSLLLWLFTRLFLPHGCWHVQYFTL